MIAAHEIPPGRFFSATTFFFLQQDVFLPIFESSVWILLHEYHKQAQAEVVPSSSLVEVKVKVGVEVEVEVEAEVGVDFEVEV